MFDFITRYKNKLEILRAQVGSVARYFDALALARAYADMVEICSLRIQGHPEVIRVPALGSMLIQHFKLYALEHISIAKGQIFNRDAVGTITDLTSWQIAGYPNVDREPDTYERRVKIFQAIWHQMPISTVITRVSKRGNVFQQRITFRPRDMRTFKIATYEDVISSRNINSGDLIRAVPWWLPLNYGTSGLGGDPGYPDVPGLHFVDIAEQLITVRQNQTRNLIQQYYSENLQTNSIIPLEEWARSHVPLFSSSIIDVFTLAQQVAQGV